MHVYRGFPERTKEGGFLITKDGQPLDPQPSQKLCDWSLEGFMWGSVSYGALQLALALLLDVTGSPELALHFHKEFEMEMIATIPGDEPWVMLEHTIKAWVRQKQILSGIKA